MKITKLVYLVAGIIFLANLVGCASNRYEQQTHVIKEHVDIFYEHVQARRIAQAVSENEQIEAVALRAEERLLRRVGQMEQAEKLQEWKIITIGWH